MGKHLVIDGEMKDKWPDTSGLPAVQGEGGSEKTRSCGPISKKIFLRRQRTTSLTMG